MINNEEWNTHMTSMNYLPDIETVHAYITQHTAQHIVRYRLAN